MKKILLLVVLAAAALSCDSVKKYNDHLADLKTEKELRRDVDYAYRKLQDLHPNLYWYISKPELDRKFDSLKATITKPMSSFEFYKKISPVIAEVRQGHLAVIPMTHRYSKAENSALTKKGVGPFSQFEFGVFDQKMYVVKNKSYDKSIKPGTEVVSINDKNPAELLNSYKTRFASDGFNKTFKNSKAARSFSNFYTNENGLQDSIVYGFKYHDSLKVVTIKRKVVDTAKTETPKKGIRIKPTAAEKLAQKAKSKKREIYGYNALTQLYNRNLRFTESDSSVAIMKIRGFSIGDAAAFYKQSFRKIRDYKSKVLVIDLRDNPGGSLREIATLYGYLTDSTYVFSDKSLVVSKTSMLNAEYFGGGPILVKAIKAAVAPIYYTYMFLKVHREADGNYYYSTFDSNPLPKKENAFGGKIYVLINGGSFSASCILSSNLKGSKRAFFVGQETGGAYNGTVAGRMPMVTLPNSKIQLRVGLMLIAPHFKTAADGRGIFPDKEIIPTLQDVMAERDPELDWILQDVKKQDNAVSQKTD